MPGINETDKTVLNVWKKIRLQKLFLSPFHRTVWRSSETRKIVVTLLWLDTVRGETSALALWAQRAKNRHDRISSMIN